MTSFFICVLLDFFDYKTDNIENFDTSYPELRYKDAKA